MLRVVATTLCKHPVPIPHNCKHNIRDKRSACITSTVVFTIQPIHPSIQSSKPMSSVSSTAPSVSLRFSLVDNPRTQIEEWYDDLMAQARRLCIQWDITGAITLVASDPVWNAVPGNITNLAAVLARGDAPQYRARPELTSTLKQP